MAMQKKKLVTLDAGDDPLSGGAPLVIKKSILLLPLFTYIYPDNNKNAFERMMREQERGSYLPRNIL